MIFANSRYEHSDTFYVGDDPSDRRIAIGPPQFYATAFTAKRHVTIEGQRLDQLAALYYGEPEMWWVIAAANPEVFYPANFPAGTVLRIPDAPAIL